MKYPLRSRYVTQAATRMCQKQNLNLQLTHWPRGALSS